jgi:hypothetical protein
MTELVSGMPAPQFGDESSLSTRIRADSRFKRLQCFILIDISCLRVPTGLRVPQVEDHWLGLTILRLVQPHVPLSCSRAYASFPS